MFDILVAGEINPDLILSGNVLPEFGQVEKLMDGAALTIGSSSAIFACGAARLGLLVAFMGVCGDDVFGRYMLDEMQKRNVDISNVIVRPDGRTGLSVIFTQGTDRAILTYPGLIAALGADDVSDGLLRQARHLHVASYFLQANLQPGLPGLFSRAHSLGLTTSLDTNWDPASEWRGFDELLSGVDVFLPNQNEALGIAHTTEPVVALTILASKARLVAMKRGAHGASLQTANTIVSVPSIPVEPVDSVGAGDSFDAGFLYGYLMDWEPERSLRMGSICGALSTQRAGGTDGQPTLPEAIKYLE